MILLHTTMVNEHAKHLVRCLETQMVRHFRLVRWLPEGAIPFRRGGVHSESAVLEVATRGHLAVLLGAVDLRHTAASLLGSRDFGWGIHPKRHKTIPGTGIRAVSSQWSPGFNRWPSWVASKRGINGVPSRAWPFRCPYELALRSSQGLVLQKGTPPEARHWTTAATFGQHTSFGPPPYTIWFGSLCLQISTARSI